jgi:hypothetical protein
VNRNARTIRVLVGGLAVPRMALLWDFDHFPERTLGKRAGAGFRAVMTDLEDWLESQA